MIPTTDFPDIRNRTAIHSKYGSCMIIPREGDVVRLYIQLSDEDALEVRNAKGRIDKTKWTPQRLMEIAKRSFQPFSIDFPKEVEWWTLYISMSTCQFDSLADVNIYLQLVRGSLQAFH